MSVMRDKINEVLSEINKIKVKKSSETYLKVSNSTLRMLIQFVTS